MKFKKWLETNYPVHASNRSAEELKKHDFPIGNQRRKNSTHDPDLMFVWFDLQNLLKQAKEIEKQWEEEVDDKEKKALGRQYLTITKQIKKIRDEHPEINKVDPKYREVDTRGWYFDRTLDYNRKRFDAKNISRHYTTTPLGNSLDVRTDSGFKELLQAKKIAMMSKDVPYAEALRQELIKRGYDTVVGGGFGEEHENEIVFLNKPNMIPLE